MRAWPAPVERRARIEIIPMIDVMMFLLVFFVLISINVLPALGMKNVPPSATRTEQIVERKKAMVLIDKDGNIALDGNRIAMDALPAELRTMEAKAKESGQQFVVAIAGDNETALQHLVDVLDALKSAGVTSSAIVAKAR